jgi:putative sulfotransferase
MAAEAVAGSGEVPVERFGEVWSRQVVAAHERLSRLARGQVLVLRYEDLAACPGPELARLAGFLDPGYEVPRGWLRASARLVERRRPAVSSLSGPQRARLEEACRPGLEILGYQ